MCKGKGRARAKAMRGRRLSCKRGLALLPSDLHGKITVLMKTVKEMLKRLGEYIMISGLMNTFCYLICFNCQVKINVLLFI